MWRWLEGDEAEAHVMATWVRASIWHDMADEGEVQASESEEGVVSLRLVDGGLEGKLDVGEGGMPTRLAMKVMDDPLEWELKEYCTGPTRSSKVPKEVVLTCEGDEEARYSVEHACSPQPSILPSMLPLSSADNAPGIAFHLNGIESRKVVAEEVGNGQGRIGIPVEITCDDHRSQEVTFLVDTGCTETVIDPAAADQLGLSSFGKPGVTTMAGRSTSTYRRASKLRVGPLSIHNAPLLDMGCDGFPGNRVRGILGMDILRAASVELDFATLTVSFTRAGQVEPGSDDVSWVSVRMEGNHPWCTASLGDDMEGLKLFVDSGAADADVYLGEDAYGGFPEKEGERVVLRDMLGARLEGRRIRVSWMSLGPFDEVVFHDVSCLVLKDGRGIPSSADGVAGAGLLSKRPFFLDAQFRRIGFSSRPRSAD